MYVDTDMFHSINASSGKTEEVIFYIHEQTKWVSWRDIER